MKIVTILGARPQFVKAAVLSRKIANYPNLNEVIVHTGQHFDEQMSDIFFQEMEIPQPRYKLNINSLGHGAMTGRMMEEIEKIIIVEKPDCLLVYGDTNSTLAGALAGIKLGVKVAHVEAGLRSFNMKMPEEVNRILTDRVSNILFCPTDQAVNNLKAEGFPFQNMNLVRTGDIMLDAAFHYQKKAPELAKIFKKTPEQEFALVTIHRQENTDDPEKLKSLFHALDVINSKLKVILPLHPRTQKMLRSYGIITSLEIINPVGYFDMIQLLSNCRIVLTDSGGLQKEAFFFKKPCVTLREETEWVELIQNQVNVLCRITKEDILNKFELMISKKCDFSINLYGTGNSADRMVSELIKG